MKIIIAGAGNLGFHLAELLSYENQDITLIDENQEVLDYASTHLDLLTLRGDSSSINVLREAGIENAHLLLAVTTSETTNIVTASLAKKLGARQTVARVHKSEYLKEVNRELVAAMGIDSIFSPVQLAAKEILRLVKRCSFTDIFEFEEGKISLFGITLDDFSPLVNVQLSNWKQLVANEALRPIAILRGSQTIIPNGEVVLKRNDHVYFITKKDKVDEVERFVGAKKVKVKNVMILGGSPLAYETAKLMEDDFNITLIEGSKDQCKILTEKLNNTLIINGKADNVDLLQEEGLDRMDAFIALTPNSETNIIASLTAKNHGVYKTIAQVENKEYTFISQNIGVDTLINQKLIAANNIFRFVRQGTVEAITGLHGVEAEVIEFVVTKNNLMTRKPIKDLHFPKAALIGGVIRGDESLIPDGNFQLQMDDKVIVFTMPEAVSKVERMFR
ncbi:MAG: Trk system potassium transporter TrkA [Lewinellaceae bacterium]|nr:Trk system potassium transporter TrkA [Saprospiraceae bacterium]MCB9336781.1 Trk system potassium transporter TrkA [Lewinellaceae bacterium]